mgnify:CR=1 FL=1
MTATLQSLAERYAKASALPFGLRRCQVRARVIAAGRKAGMPAISVKVAAGMGGRGVGGGRT